MRKRFLAGEVFPDFSLPGPLRFCNASIAAREKDEGDNQREPIQSGNPSMFPSRAIQGR
jgi:hypothetical protein